MLKKIDRIIEEIANWIVIISGVAVCALIFVGAVMRYILHKDFYGSEELILLSAFWLYFMGSTLAAKHKTHIQAEMLDMFVKNQSVHNVASIIKYIINVAMCLLASIWSIQYVVWNININMKSNVFRFPMWVSVLPIAISFVVWTFYSIRDIIQFARQLKNERTVAEEDTLI